MYRKIAYTNLGGVYRPYIQAVFCNKETNKAERTLALIDSGADTILIPHTLGLRIGLTPPKPQELKPVGGIGGLLPYTERECEIAIDSQDSTKFYIFKHIVNWVYPTPDDEQKIYQLLKRIQTIQKLLLNPANQLNHLFKQEMDNAKKVLGDLFNIYETTTLLGRTFFTNFEFINFCQRDRGSSCRFNYKISESRITQKIDRPKK